MTNQNPDIQRMNSFMRNGMTVEELIYQLQAKDPKAKVVFHFTSGDHWNTQVAEPVQSVDEAEVEWSAYHDKVKLAKEVEDWNTWDEDEYAEEDMEYEEETMTVVAIGATDTSLF